MLFYLSSSCLCEKKSNGHRTLPIDSAYDLNRIKNQYSFNWLRHPFVHSNPYWRQLCQPTAPTAWCFHSSTDHSCSGYHCSLFNSRTQNYAYTSRWRYLIKCESFNVHLISCPIYSYIHFDLVPKHRRQQNDDEMPNRWHAWAHIWHIASFIRAVARNINKYLPIVPHAYAKYLCKDVVFVIVCACRCSGATGCACMCAWERFCHS